MFTSGLTESSQREVRIVGVESESMHLVLDYAYTSRVTLSECNVQALFTAASIFQIPALQDQCAQFMISRLDPQNCIGVYMFADAYGHQELRERSQDYIRKKVSLILARDWLFAFFFEKLYIMQEHFQNIFFLFSDGFSYECFKSNSLNSS